MLHYACNLPLTTDYMRKDKTLAKLHNRLFGNVATVLCHLNTALHDILYVKIKYNISSICV